MYVPVLEIPSTGSRPAGMFAKKTLDSMDDFSLQSHKSIVQMTLYSRHARLQWAMPLRRHHKSHVGRAPVSEIFFELLVTRSSHLIFPAKLCSTFQVGSAHFMEEIGQPGRYHHRLHLEDLRTDKSNHGVLAGLTREIKNWAR